jgi:hypothetical protein
MISRVYTDDDRIDQVSKNIQIQLDGMSMVIECQQQVIVLLSQRVIAIETALRARTDDGEQWKHGKTDQDS